MTETPEHNPKTSGPDPELRIRYYQDADTQDTDTLALTTDCPGPYGENVARNLAAMSNDEGEVTGIVLEHATKLLRPYLFPES